MKKLNITYDTAKIKNGEKIVREPGRVDLGGGRIMKKCLLDHGTSDVAVADLEKLLRVVERFKGRYYIPGSIKHYELVKEG